MTSARTAAAAAAIVALIFGAAVSTTAGAAADAASPNRMTAVLRSDTSGATVRGRFYARVARFGGDRAQLHFNVTYSAAHDGSFLWPYPGIAHIHLGRPSAPGRIVIDLCCGYGFVWSSSFPYELMDRMRARGAYVELHPRSWPADTLRGQIVFR
jgi:hypothetical protein